MNILTVTYLQIGHGSELASDSLHIPAPHFTFSEHRFLRLSPASLFADLGSPADNEEILKVTHLFMQSYPPPKKNK